MHKQILATEPIHYSRSMLLCRIEEFSVIPCPLEFEDRLGLALVKTAFELIPLGGKVHEEIQKAIEKACILFHHVFNPLARGHALPHLTSLLPFVHSWRVVFMEKLGWLERLQSDGREDEAPEWMRKMRRIWLDWVCPPLDPDEERHCLLSAARTAGYSEAELSCPWIIAELRSRMLFPGSGVNQGGPLTLLWRKWDGTFGYRDKVITGRLKQARMLKSEKPCRSSIDDGPESAESPAEALPPSILEDVDLLLMVKEAVERGRALGKHTDAAYDCLFSNYTEQEASLKHNLGRKQVRDGKEWLKEELRIRLSA